MHGVTKQGSPHTCGPNELDYFPLARIELAPSAPVRPGLPAAHSTLASVEHHSQLHEAEHPVVKAERECEVQALWGGNGANPG